jgi:hypothetical protein
VFLSIELSVVCDTNFSFGKGICRTTHKHGRLASFISASGRIIAKPKKAKHTDRNRSLQLFDGFDATISIHFDVYGGQPLPLIRTRYAGQDTIVFQTYRRP